MFTLNTRKISTVMRWGATLLPVLFASALGAGTLTWSGNLDLPSSWGSLRVPKWTHGAVMVVQFHDTTAPLLWIAEPKKTYSVPFAIPGATATYVYDWDRSFDGSVVALSGSAMDKDGKGSYFIAQIPTNGSTPLITRDPFYRPRRVAFASDGTIWTAGAEPKGLATAGIFRHFDRSGKLLGAFVPQGRFADPLVPTDMKSRLMASSDRVGWYSPRGNRYIELAPDGSILTDIALPAPPDDSAGYGMALTKGGTLYISSEHHIVASEGRLPYYTWSISTLDRPTNSWKPILERVAQEHAPQEHAPSTSTPAEFAHILGVDSGLGGDSGNSGERLVISGKNTAMFFNIAQ